MAPVRRNDRFAGVARALTVAERSGADDHCAGNNTVRSIGSHVSMALGLAAGLALGLAAVLTHSPLLVAVTRWLRPLGTLFLNLLSMVVIPLVATALFAGVAGLGDLRRVGRLGIRTLAFFWGTTLAAILIGLVVAALLLPLAPITPDQQAALRQAAAADSGDRKSVV